MELVVRTPWGADLVIAIEEPRLVNVKAAVLGPPGSFFTDVDDFDVGDVNGAVLGDDDIVGLEQGACINIAPSNASRARLLLEQHSLRPTLHHFTSTLRRHEADGTPTLTAPLCEAFIAAGLDPTTLDLQKKTLIMLSAVVDHVDVCRVLHQNGASIGACDVNGWDVLLWACGSAAGKTASWLLENDLCEINVSEQQGWTPLMLAAGRGMVATVAALLAKGANLFRSDYQGMNPLMWAAETGHTECIALLLKVESDSRDPNDSLDFAEAMYVNAQCVKGKTAAYRAAEQGQTESLAVLIQNEADVDARTVCGSTALIGASCGGKVGCVGMLLEAGAEVNVVDAGGRFALGSAAQRGRVQCVDMLLSHDVVDVHLKGAGGKSALMLAAGNGYATVVEKLLAKGAVAEETCTLKRTALMWGSLAEAHNVVALLRQHRPSQEDVDNTERH